MLTDVEMKWLRDIDQYEFSVRQLTSAEKKILASLVAQRLIFLSKHTGMYSILSAGVEILAAHNGKA
jgi:hypothetical protein